MTKTMMTLVLCLVLTSAAYAINFETIDEFTLAPESYAYAGDQTNEVFTADGAAFSGYHRYDEQ